MTNPFQLWQDMLKVAMPQLQPAAPANPMQAIQAQMQQGMAAWQAMLLPQVLQPAAQPSPMAPKITVTTIELGDIRPYMDMALQLMTAMQPMLQSSMTAMFAPMLPHASRGRP